MMAPGLLFVSPETWSKSMNISESDDEGGEGNGTQMVSYPQFFWSLARC